MTKISAPIYLAGPYTHKHKKIMDKREKEHSRIACKLIKKGINLYAPIAETSGLAKHGHLTHTSWDFWRQHDLSLLSVCSELWIITLRGWEKSKGVRGEIKFAYNNNIPIKLISPRSLQILDNFNDNIDILLKWLKVNTVEELND